MLDQCQPPTSASREAGWRWASNWGGSPTNRPGLGGDRRFSSLALAILGGLEQMPLFGKERMLVDIGKVYVGTLTGSFRHQIERGAAGLNGGFDCVAGGLSQSC